MGVVGGSATVQTGTNGLDVSASVGVNVGASVMTGIGISGEILNCEPEKDCNE